jgi:radical SAM superfamily enzyme YgiQ (UPF0313 family)
MTLTAEKMALVELPPTLYGKLGGETSYDVYTKFGLPPRATPTLAGVLDSVGYPDVEQVTAFSHDKKGRFDYTRLSEKDTLFFSSITRTAPQTMELIRRYKKDRPDGIVVAGGMDASYRAEEWLKYCDVVVHGEGEKTLMELMERLEKEDELDGLEGISFKDSRGNITTNPKRELMTAKELSALPSPIYDQATVDGINIWALEQERGCPYECNFCLVTATYGRRIRDISPKKVANELRRMQQMKKTGVFFTGDNLAGNPRNAIEMLGAIKEARLYQDDRTAQVSVSAAEHPKLLQAMRSAGIKNLCVGIESINDDSLRDLGKPFKSIENTDAVRTFHDYGFWVHGMMMLGIDSDTPEVAKDTREWAKKNLDSLQLFIPTPVRGTPFWDKMEKEGRIITDDLSIYDAQHCVINPVGFTPHELQKTIFDMYEDFYSPKEAMKRLARTPSIKFTLEFLAWTKFWGGLRGITKNPQTLEHLEFLKNFT